ncbi:MAG: PAS domain S-box protein [Pseudomonadota bacterium]
MSPQPGGPTNPAEELAALRAEVARLRRERTELRRLARLARAQGHGLELLLDASPDPIFIMDPRGVILHANQALAGRLGRRRRDLIGARAWDLLPPEVARSRKAYFDQALASGQPNQFEDQWRGRHMRFQHMPVLDARGRVSRMAVFARDVTEARLAERSLRASEEKFSRAFRHAPVLMSLTVLEDGTYLDVNQKFLEVSGYQLHEVLGRTSADLGWLRPADRQRILEALRDQGRAGGLEITTHARQGQDVPCLYHCELVQINGATRLLSIALDMTQRQQAESSLLRLAAGVAHNFNNLLMAVMSNAQAALSLLETSQKDGPALRAHLHNVVRGTHDGADLVRRLSGFVARRQPQAPETLGTGDLQTLLGDMDHPGQPPAPPTPPAPWPPPGTPAAALKVLLVEDEAIVAMGLAANLRGAGHEVCHAPSLDRALGDMALFRPDLVLCDLGLPDCAGWEVFLRLARETSRLGLAQTPLVVLTGWSRDQLGQTANGPEQPAAFLQKPVESRRLLEVLAAVTATGRLDGPGEPVWGP